MTHTKKYAVWIPMFNSSKALGAAIDELSRIEWPEGTDFFLLDNCSRDDTVSTAFREIRNCKMVNVSVLQNASNIGLGGSQKQAFNQSNRLGYSYVAIFHSDFQPVAKNLKDMLTLVEEINVDALLGSRFMKNSERHSYSIVRYLGNVLLNAIFSFRFRTLITDLGSGLNVYKIDSMPLINDLPNDLSFNCNLLARLIKNERKILFFPIEWREGLAPSSLKALRLGLQTLKSMFVVGHTRNLIDIAPPKKMNPND